MAARDLYRAMKFHWACHQSSQDMLRDDVAFSRLWSSVLETLLRQMNMPAYEEPVVVALRACCLSMDLFPQHEAVIWERYLAIMRCLAQTRRDKNASFWETLKSKAKRMQSYQTLGRNQLLELLDVIYDEVRLEVEQGELKSPIRVDHGYEIHEPNHVLNAVHSALVLASKSDEDLFELCGFWPQVFARPLVEWLRNTRKRPNIFRHLGPVGVVCMLGDLDLVQAAVHPDTAQKKLHLGFGVGSPVDTLSWSALKPAFFDLQQHEVLAEDRKIIEADLLRSREEFHTAWNLFVSSPGFGFSRLRRLPSLRLFPQSLSVLDLETESEACAS